MPYRNTKGVLAPQEAEKIATRKSNGPVLVIIHHIQWENQTEECSENSHSSAKIPFGYRPLFSPLRPITQTNGT